MIPILSNIEYVRVTLSPSQSGTLALNVAFDCLLDWINVSMNCFGPTTTIQTAALYFALNGAATIGTPAAGTFGQLQNRNFLTVNANFDGISGTGGWNSLNKQYSDLAIPLRSANTVNLALTTGTAMTCNFYIAIRFIGV
jgi:hypothetical protein